MNFLVFYCRSTVKLRGVNKSCLVWFVDFKIGFLKFIIVAIKLYGAPMVPSLFLNNFCHRIFPYYCNGNYTKFAPKAYAAKSKTKITPVKLEPRTSCDLL